jgi:hypothetical protein
LQASRGALATAALLAAGMISAQQLAAVRRPAPGKVRCITLSASERERRKARRKTAAAARRRNRG